MDFLTESFRLPLARLGLRNLPAFPFNIAATIETLLRLKERQGQLTGVVDGYSNAYTIGGQTTLGRDFLYGDQFSDAVGTRFDTLHDHLQKVGHSVADAFGLVDEIWKVLSHAASRDAPAPAGLTGLPLEAPEQFTIGWTNFNDVYLSARPQAADFAGALTSVAGASESFWPMIAEHGQAYNLLILQKVGEGNIGDVEDAFHEVWTAELDAAAKGGELYVIDLRMFGSTNPVAGGQDLFTPATLTLLRRDPATKRLEPVAVLLSGEGGADAVVYTPANASNGAWIYALEAVRTSVTIYGIAIGHVYHWHLPTAALFMTFAQTVPQQHPLQNLVAPQSRYITGFDDVLLLLWGDIVPPMSVASGIDFLRLADGFAAGRTFWDDDPLATIARLGLRQEDFTDKSPWDLYPVVADLLCIWNATVTYVQAFVDATYPTDESVASDRALQAWVAASADPDNGNIAGLGPIATRAAVAKLLRSLIFRVTMHGVSNLNQTAYPTLSFVANYPTCLNGRTLPPAAAPMSTQDILRHLPNTGQIGRILTFYNTFVFTSPYESFVPESGIETRLQFPGGLETPCNRALVDYRIVVRDFVRRFQTLPVEIPPPTYQWPLCVEL